MSTQGAKMIWAKRGLAAVPVNAEALDFLNGHEDGDKFLLEGRNPRNLEQLQLFWSLMQVIADNDAAYSTRYQVRWDIFSLLEERAERPGYFMETWRDRWGNARSQPRSIAFESMAQTEFNSLFQRCLDIAVEWSGSRKKEIEAEVWALIEPNKGIFRKG